MNNPIGHKYFDSRNYLLLLAFNFLIASCMYLPIPRDDLDVLGDDYFSELVRSAYSSVAKGDKKYGGGVVGFGRIDKHKIRENSKGKMKGRSAQYVIDYFTKRNGSCLSLNEKAEASLSCEVVRKWKLSNVGAGGVNPNWSEPAIKLVYSYSLSDTSLIIGSGLEIIDVTKYKRISD